MLDKETGELAVSLEGMDFDVGVHVLAAYGKLFALHAQFADLVAKGMQAAEASTCHITTSVGNARRSYCCVWLRACALGSDLLSKRVKAAAGAAHWRSMHVHELSSSPTAHTAWLPFLS